MSCQSEYITNQVGTGNIPLGYKKQPVQASAPGCIDSVIVALQVHLLLVHPQHVGQSGGLAQIEPCLVMHVQAVVHRKQEETCAEGIHARRSNVIVALANADCLFHQERACDNVAAKHHVGVEGVVHRHSHSWHHHSRLKADERAKRRQEAVCVEILFLVHGVVLEALAVEDRHRRVHVSKEKFEAGFEHFLSQESRSRRQRLARSGAVDAILEFYREAGLALCFLQFIDNLCPGALGPLLLRNRIVCAGELRRRAIATRVDSVAFDLATMAGIASPLHCRRHCS